MVTPQNCDTRRKDVWVEIEPHHLHVQTKVEPTSQRCRHRDNTDLTPNADRTSDILLVVYKILFTPIEQMVCETQRSELQPHRQP